MADQKKTTRARKRKEVEPTTTVPDKATKEEYNIARWMRNNVPVKKTKFLSHTVEYFTGCKAVDQLLDSPWSQPQKAGEEALFTTRESVVEYLDTMLRHKLFHRARKIVVPENELKSKKKKDKEDKDKDKNQKKEEKEFRDQGAKTKVDDMEESSQAEGEKGDKSSKKEEGDKKKKKVRLDMHLEQAFVDGIDAYVWIYEPTPYYYYFFGLLVVVAVIAICLFPLWPSSVRQGVYYLSLAAAGFLVFILALAIIRLLVFCAVWALTFGHRHFWLLPNLTEDVGFFASFWPLYKYEYKGNESGDKSLKERKESEPGDEVENTESGKSESEARPQPGESAITNVEGSHSETESDESQKSQTDRDFELVDREEIDS